jgi:peptidoglycan/xylan/chitin deacetylase (PgdA/CDA1 family)
VNLQTLLRGKGLFNKIAVRLIDWQSHTFSKHPIKMRNQIPLISFTFDDAPKTAFDNGGCILKKYQLSATFYISLSMLGQDSPSGVIGSFVDLEYAYKNGHEIGCHTFSHENAWNVTPRIFEQSIIENLSQLKKIFPCNPFKTFAYPYGSATPMVKKIINKYYLCGRGGGQRINVGIADLNFLNSCFIDELHGVERPTMDALTALIRINSLNKGWLIFATHDVANKPSRYGCTPERLEKIIEYSLQSGATVLPVEKACDFLLGQ